MPNYKIIVEYDGTDFSGWQYQQNQRTVQGDIERSIMKLTQGKPVRIHGAGRTDSGVHARGQTANFILDKKWDPTDLRNALNGNLSDDIFVHVCQVVPDDFHSRFDATRRCYRYRCRIKKSVMDRKYVWHVPFDISVKKLQLCSKVIVGERDFTSFCKFNRDQNNSWCFIHQSEWIKDGDFVIFMVEANRFLHHLIRYLVGTMMEVAKGNLTVSDFTALLNARDPQAKIYKAPSCGLILEHVKYE